MKNLSEVTSQCNCQRCKRVYDESIRPCPYCGYNLRHISIIMQDTINIRSVIDIKKYSGSTKKFVAHTKNGWFSSVNKDEYPEGVYLTQTVDRENKLYKKKVINFKTNEIIKDLEEPLMDHLNHKNDKYKSKRDLMS